MDRQRPAVGRSSRTWRLAGLTAVATTVGIGAAFVLVPFAARGLVAALDLVLDAFIWLSMSFDGDADVWTVLAAIGRSAAGALVTRRALASLGTLVLLSSVALYGLQRLLGAEEESSK
jgi:hypothetical protein